MDGREGIQAQQEMDALKAEKERTEEEKQKIAERLTQQHVELQSHYQVAVWIPPPHSFSRSCIDSATSPIFLDFIYGFQIPTYGKQRLSFR